LLRRQAREQTLTLDQFFAQRRRQLISKQHATQAILGNAALLPGKPVVPAPITIEDIAQSDLSSLLGPGATPASPGYLTGTKQRAPADGIGCCALVKCAAGAALPFRKPRELFDICTLRVRHVAYSHGLRTRLIG
jgi:hypothetical protein